MNTKQMTAVVLAAVILGCSQSDAPAPPKPGFPVPAYEAVDMQGQTVSLESLKGDVVLLNMWATWCGPCRMETPFLQELYEQHIERGFHIIGASMDTGNAADQVQMFTEEYGVTYTILLDPQMRGMDSYQVLGLPATFLIDREGVLQWMKYGPLGETDSEFQEALEDALR
jgi:cytochrome c-type biogenesis protein